MHYLITILFICSLSVALSHPELKRRDDDDDDEEYDEKPHRSRPSLFGSGNHDFFRSGFRQLNDFMRSVSDMFRKQIESASHMMRDFGKGYFNMDDITTNTTVNSSESHTEQVGDNYVITNITRLDKVDPQGKKYRIINKNVRVKPVNGSEDILNSDRTYVIMEPEKVNEPKSHGSHRDHSKKTPEDRSEIEPSVTIDKFPSVTIDKFPSVATKTSDKSSSVGTESTEQPPSVATDAETLGERENVDIIPTERSFDKQWEKVDQNVMFDKKKHVVTADLERNDIFK